MNDRLPNKNYQRGRAREYQVMKILRSRGWVCSRSAMSHGPVDVFAAREGKVLLIQVKSGTARMKKDDILVLKTWAGHFNAYAEVWHFRNRSKVKKVSIFEPNPAAGQTTIPLILRSFSAF